MHTPDFKGYEKQFEKKELIWVKNEVRRTNTES